MKSSHAALILASCMLLVLVAYMFAPLLRCLDHCFVDLVALHGRRLGSYELPDTRLNVWILAWVQHGLLAQPLELFNANVLYPARNILAGSEHMIGLAVLTLPLRLVTTNAVLLYQLTLVLSSVILVATTFALVRWLTGSVWGAALAGAMALLMPWRIAELTHLQLLGAHWFPLIWLLTLRILLGEAQRWDAIVLSVVLSLQLLSSYYLAYMLTFSLAVVVVLVAIQTRLKHRPIRRLALAAVGPYLLLVLVSVPYLQRRASGELFATPEPETAGGAEAMAAIWRLIAPSFEAGWTQGPTVAYSYSIPLVVGVLALIALIFSLTRSSSEGKSLRMGIAAIAFWVCSLGAVVMMLGPEILIGGVAVKLPSYWASQFVPGFSSLRAPHRWTIVMGLAFPVLASLGMVYLERGVGERKITRVGIPLQLMVRILVALLLLINLPWRQLPAQEAWKDRERIISTYEALRALPYGPVVEVPWKLDASAYVQQDTRYMLASTLHWWPILNGFTAYLPPSFKFLRRTAQRLPEEDAIGTFSRLTDVRWIVVHLDKLLGSEAMAWRNVLARGDLRRAYEDNQTWIFEIPRHSETGMWMGKLASTEVRAQTLKGLPRLPLKLSANAGRIEARLPGRFHYRGMGRSGRSVELRVTNASAVDWPGFDYQTEGLVELRYKFLDEGDRVVKTETASLGVDIPARTATWAYPFVTPPVRQGKYRLRLDLVQRIGGTLRTLPLDSVDLDVEVTQVGTGTNPIYNDPAQGTLEQLDGANR